MIDNKNLATAVSMGNILAGIATVLLLGVAIVVVIGGLLYQLLIAAGVAGLSVMIDGGLPVYPVEGIAVKYPIQVEEKYKKAGPLSLTDFQIPTVGDVRSIDLTRSTFTTDEVVVKKSREVIGDTTFDMEKYHASAYDRYFLVLKGDIYYCISGSEDNCDTRKGVLLLYQSAK